MIRPIHIISLDAVELDVCYHLAFALPAEPHELWGVGEERPYVGEEGPQVCEEGLQVYEEEPQVCEKGSQVHEEGSQVHEEERQVHEEEPQYVRSAAAGEP